jgi:hypothetical protein
MPAVSPVTTTSELPGADEPQLAASQSAPPTRASRVPKHAGPRDTIAERTFASTEQAPAAAAAPEQPDPAHWLEDIRELRRRGRAAQADREWERFREAYPEYQVAEDDLARTKQ